MRRLIILVLVIATAYGGYWFYGRSALEDGIAQALRGAEGGRYDIAYSDWGVQGFPSRFDTTFEAPQIADRLSGFEWSAPWLRVFALSYRPNEVIAVLPEEQSLSLGGQPFTLFTNDMRASAKVGANTDLSFERATLEIQNPRLRAGDGSELAMAHLLAAARANPDTANGYDLYLDAQSIVLPQWLRDVLDPDATLPPLIRQLRLDSVATLNRALDRHAGDGAPVQLEALSITELGLMWGDISLSAIGDITAGENGVAEGSLTLSAANWRQALDMAVAAGLIEEGFATTYASMADQLDETPHLADTLTVTLSFRDGQSKLGPLAVGPAPRLY